MRKSLFIRTTQTFGKSLPDEQAAGLFPSLRFHEGKTVYKRKGSKSYIAQEFKGRLGYLQQFDLVLDESINLPIKVKQPDLYIVYLMQASNNIQFTDEQHLPIASLNKRRALYIYLPKERYHLQLPRGSYHLLVCYFDVGIFDGGADTDFDFLQPLLEAHRQKSSTPLVSRDFMIGPVTESYIRSLCKKLKKADVDSQIVIISLLKELIKLSKRKMLLESTSTGQYDHYVEIAKNLILEGVEDKGILYDLTSLTETIPLSLKHFNRIFKLNTYYTLERYRKHCLAERSQTLLREGLPVWKVGLMIGYRETRSFRRFFKQAVGVAPGEYQQNSSKYSI